MRRNRTARRTDDGVRERGVSDLVAFVLTFGIVITGVGIVSTGGFGTLMEFTDTQQIENSDRGLQATAATLDDIHRQGDTYREFDFGPGGGELFYNATRVTLESPDLNLSAVGPTGNEDSAVIPVGALENQFDGTSLAYEAGAVLRTDSASPRYGPSFQCHSSKPAVVSLVNLTTDETIEESAADRTELRIQPTRVPEDFPVSANNRFVRFNATLVDSERILERTGGTAEITLDVSGTAHPEQWDDHFRSADGWEDDGGTWRCESERMLVRVTTVELSVLEP